jgi:hypothetical protein
VYARKEQVAKRTVDMNIISLASRVHHKAVRRGLLVAINEVTTRPKGTSPGSPAASMADADALTWQANDAIAWPEREIQAGRRRCGLPLARHLVDGLRPEQRLPAGGWYGRVWRRARKGSGQVETEIADMSDLIWLSDNGAYANPTPWLLLTTWLRGLGRLHLDSRVNWLPHVLCEVLDPALPSQGIPTASAA